MTTRSLAKLLAISKSLLALTIAIGMVGGTLTAAEKQVELTITGGHETDPKDGGRPVVLIAAALGVKTEVFREAFSGVRPAKNGKPSPEDARRNKEALMKVLKSYNVTNDRLDEVSNYYRYQPQKGELWTNKPAKAHAIIEDGKVKRIVVTEPGAGYSSPPKITIPGMEKVELEVKLQFEKDLKKNGGIKSIEVVSPKSPASK